MMPSTNTGVDTVNPSHLTTMFVAKPHNTVQTFHNSGSIAIDVAHNRPESIAKVSVRDKLQYLVFPNCVLHDLPLKDRIFAFNF